MTENKIIQRLHISGLNPEQCSLDDLKSRFSSFSLEIKDIFNWPPKNNAVGNKTNWCFINIEGNENNIKKAINILNNTMWKGGKLRIGNAKEEIWKQNRKIDSNEPIKSKNKRKSQAIESSNINQLVTSEEEPGWKTTPEGNRLIFPMRMRPDRPIIKTATIKERKNKSKDDSKKIPRSRAMRTVIDPTRYNQTYISFTNENEKESFSNNFTWKCEQEGNTIIWTLIDNNGKIIKEEIVQLKDDVVEREEEDDNDEFDDEIDAAIAEAQDESTSSDEKEEGEQQGDILDEIDVAIPNYDPEEDENFSDGYIKDANDSIQSLYWPENKNEKSFQLELLKNMFGNNEKQGILQAKGEEIVQLDSESDEKEEEEVGEQAKINQSGIERRKAMLLNNSNLSNSNQQNQFQPIQRFEPIEHEDDAKEEVQEVQEDDDDDDEQMIEESEIEEKTDNENLNQDQVQFETLTNLFAPKRKSKDEGFSLMADLDLDLDDDFTFEEEEDDDEGAEDVQIQNKQIQKSNLIQKPPSTTLLPSKTIFTFPNFDENGNIKSNGLDLYSLLLKKRKELKNQNGNSEFSQLEDFEFAQKKLEWRRENLIPIFKKRHREAIKQRRKFHLNKLNNLDDVGGNNNVNVDN